MASISVLLVLYNSGPVVGACLASLGGAAPGHDLDVVVVDNASADNGAEVARKAFPAATILVNDRNVGFAAANNQALRMARGDFLCLLNADTVVHGAALARMAALLRRTDGAGAVGPLLRHPDGSVQQPAYRFNSLWSEFMEAAGLWRIPPPLHHRLGLSYPPSETPHLVDWVTGAALMLPRRVYETVGGLDEGFFMYWEDADLCARIRDAGCSVWLEPGAEVTHLGGQSSQGLRKEMRLAAIESKLRFLRKHGFARPVGAVKAMAVAGFAARAAAGRVAAMVPGRAVAGRRSADVNAYCLRALLFGPPAAYQNIVARRCGHTHAP